MSRGGFRHGTERTAVEYTVRIDCKQLRERGVLTVGRSACWDVVFRGATLVMGCALPTPTLLVLIVKHVGAGSVTQRIRVSWTPCRFGGERAWLHCPYCERRVFRLYMLPSGNEFHCRHCLHLTYELIQSARRFKARQAAKRVERYMRKMGADWDTVGLKPKGMHYETFKCLWKEYDAAYRELMQTPVKVSKKRQRK